MLNCILNIFETYQTFFTGMLGFAGVIITMIVSAKTQRKLQKDRIEHEKRALRVALKSELIATRNSYELRIDQLNEPGHENDDVLIQNKIVDGIYRTLLDKIGLLTEEEVEKILNAYLLMAELPYGIRILTGTDNIGGYENEFIRVKKHLQSTVEKMHKSYLPKINDAIESIDKQLNSTQP